MPTKKPSKKQTKTQGKKKTCCQDLASSKRMDTKEQKAVVGGAGKYQGRGSFA